MNAIESFDEFFERYEPHFDMICQLIDKANWEDIKNDSIVLALSYWPIGTSLKSKDCRDAFYRSTISNLCFKAFRQRRSFLVTGDDFDLVTRNLEDPSRPFDLQEDRIDIESKIDELPEDSQLLMRYVLKHGHMPRTYSFEDFEIVSQQIARCVNFIRQSVKRGMQLTAKGIPEVVIAGLDL